MPAAETVFEYLAMALEATKGTAVTPPTHYLPFSGSIKPVRNRFDTRDSNGTLAGITRSQTVSTGSEWEGEGAVDPAYAPLLLNLIIKSVTSPSTPTNGVLTRLWTFAPAMTSDATKSATMYFGDPNVQIFQSAYCMAEEMTISADAAGEDAATWSIKGFGRFPTRVSAPTMPAQAVGSLVMPAASQLWIDTSSAIGTTEVTGRFISTELTIPTGIVQKRYASGPTGGLNFTKHGIGARSATAKFTVELNDISIGAGKEYLLWEADTQVKMRIRLNGSLIESVTPDYYEYVQLDIYGPLRAFEWGTVADTNRTMTFSVMSEYNSYAASAGYDWAMAVQNQKAAL
jgi:hypothetical protein